MSAWPSLADDIQNKIGGVALSHVGQSSLTHAMLKQHVGSFRRRFAPVLDEQLRHYQQLGSLEDVVRFATNALNERGKIESHQCRVGRTVLARAAGRLLKHVEEIRSCRCFADLIACVECYTANVIRFGPLAAYDTALRIGAYLNLWPEEIYLHAGVKAGARALGLPTNRRTLPMSELPPVIRSLEPYQAESFLCIFKDELGGKPGKRSKCEPKTPRRRTVIC